MNCLSVLGSFPRTRFFRTSGGGEFFHFVRLKQPTAQTRSRWQLWYGVSTPIHLTYVKSSWIFPFARLAPLEEHLPACCSAGLRTSNWTRARFKGNATMVLQTCLAVFRVQLRLSKKALDIWLNTCTATPTCSTCASLPPARVKAVQNMWGVLKELSLFFHNSPKRQSQFENVASEEDTPNRRKKLVQLSRTRWVARHTSLSTFRQLYSVVVTTLDIIANEEGWNAESTSKASGFLAAVTSFPYLVAFLITWRVLEYCQVCLFSFKELLKCFCDHALSGWEG